MKRKKTFLLLTFLIGLATSSLADQLFAPYSTAYPRIEIAKAPAPLFDDPVFHGASDPFVLWNPEKKLWFMYYTQRRSNLPNAKGYTWVHGSKIGIATSRDGLKWDYAGTCQGDHNLSEPLKSTVGRGPEPGVTWWAPAYFYEGGILHMYVSLIDGVYPGWSGKRSIVHFTSEDWVNFTWSDTPDLDSPNVIDPMVYKVRDTYYLDFKDDRYSAQTQRVESKDLKNWGNKKAVHPDKGQEAPFVFFWKNSYWRLNCSQGLKIYKSPNGVDQWEFSNKILDNDSNGIRSKDQGRGLHPSVIVQKAPDGTEQCVMFYFTHQENLSVIQMAELELGPDGKVTCNRDKYVGGK